MLGLEKIFGDHSSRTVKATEPTVVAINALEADFLALSDEALKDKTDEFKAKIKETATGATLDGIAGTNNNSIDSTTASSSDAAAADTNSDITAEAKILDEILPEAFAAVREASRRTLGQRHFDVQLVGGIVLHQGNIAEMKTGEGKTLVATLPAYLNALTGRGVHIVTVNDYLSRRDAVWMGQIYSALGLSVGVINHEASYLYDPSHIPPQESAELDKKRDEVGSFKVVYEFLRPCTRHEAYMADITYGTNNEFGFDYLRDNIEYDVANLRQRDFNYAIVDEIDSILIDEARTPLIISAPTVDSENLYAVFAGIAGKLNEGTDYEVDEKKKAISLTQEGITKAEKLLGVDNIYTDKGTKHVHHLETAVRAKALFKNGKEYVVKNNEVIIVDEFTGRLQPGRRWSEGLHQAIEAKEGVAIQKESRTYASITFQNYFRLYKKLAGMTGTAMTSKEEFFKVYRLDVVAVPTNMEMIRVDNNDLIFQTEMGKFKAVSRKIKEINGTGQPVLVGTVSIEKNELLSQFLTREGVRHQVLNAKNHEKEGEIIAAAGRKGSVTIATNMAGRGVDIKLGGPEAKPEEAEEIKKLGGLFVLGTERHEARRIDNQLRGRSGRQGDPGATQFFVSMEDTLMRVFASDMIKNLMGRFGIPEDEPIENRIVGRALETAQTKIEGFHFDSRKHTLDYDDVLNYQRKIVYQRRRKILLGTGEELKATIDEILGLDEITDNTQHTTDNEQQTADRQQNTEIRNQRAEDGNGGIDGSSTTAVTPDQIEYKKKQLGAEQFYQMLRRLLLQTIDMFWIDHLEVMEYLRSSVNLRAYGQRDPLVEYKRDGLRLYKEMEAGVIAQVHSMIPNLGAMQADALRQEEQKMRQVQKSAQLLGGSTVSTEAIRTQNPTLMVSGLDAKEIGRNDKVFVTKGTEEREIKFKKLDQFLKEGWTVKK
jgi:preprotein translocase subunit SecA